MNFGEFVSKVYLYLRIIYLKIDIKQFQYYNTVLLQIYNKTNPTPPPPTPYNHRLLM